MFQGIGRECFTIVCHKSVERRARVPAKSVSEECSIKVSHKSTPQAPQEYATRVSQKSVLQEWLFNAIEHLLFAFHCSVGTLLLRELLKNACGLVASIRFIFLFRVKTFGYSYQ